MSPRFTSRLHRALLAALLVAVSGGAFAAGRANGQTDYLPPWNPPPAGGVHFSVPPVDAIADLHGDIVDPQLVVFFAGNQFMVVHDLLEAFKQVHPQYQRIYAETLPPGILAKQIESGTLVMGNLRITLKPDIYTAGKDAIAEQQKQHDWFADSYDYARNPLAILVARGNPKHIEGLADLGRADVRVSMPNPAWEGIAKQIEASYRKAGGDALDHTIMDTKVKDGSTFLTRISSAIAAARVTGRVGRGTGMVDRGLFPAADHAFPGRYSDDSRCTECHLHLHRRAHEGCAARAGCEGFSGVHAEPRSAGGVSQIWLHAAALRMSQCQASIKADGFGAPDSPPAACGWPHCRCRPAPPMR